MKLLGRTCLIAIFLLLDILAFCGGVLFLIDCVKSKSFLYLIKSILAFVVLFFELKGQYILYKYFLK